MFDIGWSEMAVIMLVALVVIGPKDLPRLARTVGQWVAKGRAMAREFQRSLEDMAREAELDDVKREIEKVGRTDIKRSIEKTIDPTGELGKAFEPTSRASSSKPPAKASVPAPNGEAPNGEAPNGEATQAAAARPKAASEPQAKIGQVAASAEPVAPATPKRAKPKAGAKPKAAAKPGTSAKPRTSAKPKAAPPKTTEAKTMAEPH
jgi:sec-independent protein translocase protein TatB